MSGALDHEELVVPAAARTLEGFRFLASPVWGRSFRVRRVTDRLGLPDFRLDVR